jgi:drug/metabolite transporter (DMT)-like permease
MEIFQLMENTVISLLAGIGGMVGWGIYDFFAGVYSKKIGPSQTFFWSQLSGLFCTLAFFLLLSGTVHLTGLVCLYLVVAALLYTGGYLFFMRGFELGNISIIAAIMNVWAVFTMLFAFLFMGQRLSSIQFIGVCMIISGAMLASLNWKEVLDGGKFQLSKGVKEAVVGAFLFGLFWNVSEVVTERIGWLATTMYVKVLIICLFVLLSLLTKQKIGRLHASGRTKGVIVFIGIVEAGAVGIVNYGLTVGDAILITPIASALSIVTIVMAIVLLKERVSWPQAAGMLIAVSGIIITGL